MFWQFFGDFRVLDPYPHPPCGSGSRWSSILRFRVRIIDWFLVQCWPAPPFRAWAGGVPSHLLLLRGVLCQLLRLLPGQGQHWLSQQLLRYASSSCSLVRNSCCQCFGSWAKLVQNSVPVPIWIQIQCIWIHNTACSTSGHQLAKLFFSPFFIELVFGFCRFRWTSVPPLRCANSTLSFTIFLPVPPLCFSYQVHFPFISMTNVWHWVVRLELFIAQFFLWLKV